MKRLFVAVVLINGGLLYAEKGSIQLVPAIKPSMEESNNELRKRAQILQKALAECHKKCESLKVEEKMVEEAYREDVKKFIELTKKECHSSCDLQVERAALFVGHEIARQVFDKMAKDNQ